jgi:hypothetical protein
MCGKNGKVINRGGKTGDFFADEKAIGAPGYFDNPLHPLLTDHCFYPFYAAFSLHSCSSFPIPSDASEI